MSYCVLAFKFSKNDHLILTRTDDRTVHAFFLKIFQKSNDQSFILLESQLIIYTYIICVSCKDVKYMTRFLLEYIQLKISLFTCLLLA